MPSFLDRLSPPVTNMIRLDHTQVQAAFRQFETETSPRVKKGLADSVCVALEIHAQLEEEIFYPALRAVSDTETLRKAGPEHGEMRELCARLRGLDATDPAFDDTFFALARVVMHHVADEETLLLPAAERLMPERLGELGTQMARRRFQLMGPRSGEIAGSMARSLSPGTLAAAAGALLSGGYLMLRHQRLPGPVWSRKAWGR